MNQLSVFNFRSTEVRTVVIDGEVWFVASDVAKALQYRDARDMTRLLDSDEKGTHIVRTPSGDQEMIVINESGMYHAVLKSRKPEAKRTGGRGPAWGQSPASRPRRGTGILAF